MPKYARLIRWTHWFNFLLLLIMIWSGILIYWANQAYVQIPDSLASALNLEFNLALGMGWHFTFMWLFAFNGLVYLAYFLFSKHWRKIGPDNKIQRLAYFSILLAALGSIVTGFAIYKPVQLGWLTALLGGYEAARFEHFLLTVTFVLFLFVHVVQVARAGWNNFLTMSMGYKIGTSFALVAIAIIFWINSATEIDGASAPLRKAMDFNAAISEKLYSPNRVSVSLPKPKGAPRVNGDVGLSTPVDMKTYIVKIESGDFKTETKVDDLKKGPMTHVSTLFKCIEGWSEPVSYAGLKFSDFMEAYNVGKKADGTYYKYVALETPDEEYYVSIDMDSMRHSQTVLAFEMNEQPLSLENGFPVRLVIPIKYGIKSLKRIGRIYFSDTRPPDYWHEQGYDWYAGL